MVITVHEFAHGFIAHKLGDPTAKSLGRVSLNPFVHLDPIGTLMILLIGFGWGKPVPFNPLYFKNPKKDAALVSLAGPAANILLAVLFALIGRLVNLPLVNFVVFGAVFYNLMLALFNLLPIHPLDGFKIVLGILPPNLAADFAELAPYGLYILIFLMLTPLLDMLVGVPLNFLTNLFLGF